MSQQTVARRYRRMRSEGVLRVVGMTDARRIGQVEWFVRTRRGVQLTSGGTEISCVTRAPGEHAPEALLLQQLPKTPRVESVSAHCLLRSFVGGPVGWHGRASVLTAEQVAALTPSFEPAAAVVEVDGDERLLAAL